MASDTLTIEQFVKRNRISLKAERVGRNPHMEDTARGSMDHWKITLLRPSNRKEVDTGRGIAVIFSGRKLRMTLYFSKGYGHNGAEPKVDEVLDRLSSDAATIDNSQNFEDWCSELGFDTDSRKAEKTFKACEHQAKRLLNFLGDDLYQTLLCR